MKGKMGSSRCYWGFQVACPGSGSNLGACTLIREFTVCVFAVVYMA